MLGFVVSRKEEIMNNVPHSNRLTISDLLAAIIQYEVDRSKIDVSNGVVLSFKDPDYSAEGGGYHPVEIAMQNDGRLMYITDFSYVGIPPYAELVKELDFDFGYGVLQQFGREYPLEQAAEIFAMWQTNFVSYHGMGVYRVTVGEL